MNSGINKRIEVLENRYRADPLIVLCEIENEIREMTARECYEKGAEFIKVLRGGNIEEIDYIIKSLHKEEY